MISLQSNCNKDHIKVCRPNNGQLKKFPLTSNQAPVSNINTLDNVFRHLYNIITCVQLTIETIPSIINQP